MKTLLMVVGLCMITVSVHAAWQSELIEDPITNKQLGQVQQIVDGQMLFVGCAEDQPLMVMFFFKERVSDDVRMNIRLDQGEVMSPVAQYDATVNATFPVSKVYNLDLIKAMRSARQLHVRVELSNGAMMRSVSYGLDEFAERLRSVCGWHPDYQVL